MLCNAFGVKMMGTWIHERTTLTRMGRNTRFLAGPKDGESTDVFRAIGGRAASLSCLSVPILRAFS